MEGYEDDDDTHFCNKCHATINGLENYVRHRQSGCRTGAEDKTEGYHCPPSTPNVSYPEILNADAFFSSLELQSSAKPQPRRSDLLGTRLRRSSRHEERRKRKRKDKSPDEKYEAKEKLANLLPVVTDLDDLGIPSLVGFPEIVASTSTSKPTTSSVTSSSKLVSPGGNVSKLDGSSYSGKVSEPKRQEHHHWLDDRLLTDLVVNENESKEDLGESHLDRYEEYDYHQDEDSDEDSLEEDMAEEDSYSDSEDPDTHDQDTHDQDTHDPDAHDPDAQDPEYPPHSHTGGKWKPGSIAQLDVHQVHEDDVEMEENEQHHEHPPPSYTGGKWKPTESSFQVYFYIIIK